MDKEQLIVLKSELKRLANEYGRSSRKDAWENGDSEAYGLNEFLKGKAEGFEEALLYISEHE